MQNPDSNPKYFSPDVRGQPMAMYWYHSMRTLSELQLQLKKETIE
jgi:hypothetical protein